MFIEWLKFFCATTKDITRTFAIFAANLNNYGLCCSLLYCCDLFVWSKYTIRFGIPDSCLCTHSIDVKWRHFDDLKWFRLIFGQTFTYSFCVVSCKLLRTRKYMNIWYWFLNFNDALFCFDDKMWLTKPQIMLRKRFSFGFVCGLNGVLS